MSVFADWNMSWWLVNDASEHKEAGHRSTERNARTSGLGASIVLQSTKKGIPSGMPLTPENNL
ncbi:MAG: hypothetical protein IJV27_09965 [Prevotella sp.]|nr:hypothetical protein [Prevotella sp.]